MPPWSVALPLMLLGLVVAGYWYRVMRMARKARQRTGRAANLLPPEPVGRVLRVVWVPVVVTWMAHPFVSAFVDRLPPPLRPVAWSPVAAWAGVAVAAACFAATRVCWRRMGTAWRMGIDPNEQTPLVATGPFAYVRHPIYALSALMMLATVVAVPSPLMIAVGAAHIALLVWESQREERHMLRLHGQAYARYRQRVGRFIPASARPYVAAADGRGENADENGAATIHRPVA